MDNRQPSTPDDGQCKASCEYNKILEQNGGLQNETPNDETNEPSNDSSKIKDDKTNNEELEDLEETDDGQCKPSCEYNKTLAQKEGLENETKNSKRHAPRTVSDEIKEAMMRLNNQQENTCNVENPCISDFDDSKEDQQLADTSGTKPLEDVSLAAHSDVEVRTRDKYKEGPNSTSIFNTKSLTMSTRSVDIKNVEVTEGRNPCNFGSSKEQNESDEENTPKRCNCLIKECRIKLKFKEFLTSISQRSYKKGPIGRWQHSVI